MTSQLSLFAPNENDMDKRIRRIEVDGVILFSVLDVFQHYGKSSNPTMAWKTVQKRLDKQGFDLSKEILDRVLEGGRRPTPFTSFKIMLRIAQVSDFKEWESIRQWMAEIAHERIEEASNPELGVKRAQKRAEDTYKHQGKDDRWIATRLHSIDERLLFTASLKQHVIDIVERNYGEGTNLVYKGLWGRKAADLRKEMGLPDGTPIRDYQTIFALHYQGIVESMIAFYLERDGATTWEDAKALIRRCAEVIGIQADSLAESMGIDLATGKPLLKKGSA